MHKYPVRKRVKFNNTLAVKGNHIDLPDGVAVGLIQNGYIGPALTDEAAAAIDAEEAEKTAAAAQAASKDQAAKDSATAAAKTKTAKTSAK